MSRQKTHYSRQNKGEKAGARADADREETADARANANTYRKLPLVGLKLAGVCVLGRELGAHATALGPRTATTHSAGGVNQLTTERHNPQPLPPRVGNARRLAKVCQGQAGVREDW